MKYSRLSIKKTNIQVKPNSWVFVESKNDYNYCIFVREHGEVDDTVYYRTGQMVKMCFKNIKWYVGNGEYRLWYANSYDFINFKLSPKLIQPTSSGIYYEIY